MSRARDVGLPLLTVLAIAVRAVASDWDATDAATLGRGGVGALVRLDRSPGAPVDCGLRLGMTAAELFSGTGIEVVSLQAQAVRARWATGASLAQLRSDVAHETEVDLSLQHRRGMACVGAGASFQQASFEGYAPLRQASMRFGAGANAGRVRAAFLLEGVRFGAADEGPRIVVAAEAVLAGALGVAVQVERQAARVPRTRAGISWGRGALRVLAGQDVATGTSTMGLGLAAGKLHVDWAASTHPDLGWSQAWTCEIWR